MTAPFNKNYFEGYTPSGNAYSTPPTAAPSAASGGYSGADWSSIIQGLGQGASAAMGGASAPGFKASKKEAIEAKRRLLANLLSQSLNRNQKIANAEQTAQASLQDEKSSGLQNTARGFVHALSGSSRR